MFKYLPALGVPVTFYSICCYCAKRSTLSVKMFTALFSGLMRYSLVTDGPRYRRYLLYLPWRRTAGQRSPWNYRVLFYGTEP